jgi:hypothetical protein
MQSLEKEFDDWHDMVEDMHEHVNKQGFYLDCWTKVISDESPKRDKVRIGFYCNKTNITWHMHQDDWNEQNPIGKNLWKDKDRKKAYIKALQFRLSIPQHDTPKCRVKGCEHTANPKKEQFCGWCYNRFQKGMLDQDGNRILSWKERKEKIRSKFKKQHLKVLQRKYPETVNSFICTKIQITIEEASCFRRIFIDQNTRSACAGCHIHDPRFDFLETFLEKEV